jgi:hypothetical protein
MNDANDVYVRQCLKNWAAQQQPPANGRARLLLKVSSPEAPSRNDTLSRMDKDGHYYALASSQSPSERIVEPFSQSRLWVLHMTLTPLRHVA